MFNHLQVQTFPYPPCSYPIIFIYAIIINSSSNGNHDEKMMLLFFGNMTFLSASLYKHRRLPHRVTPSKKTLLIKCKWNFGEVRHILFFFITLKQTCFTCSAEKSRTMARQTEVMLLLILATAATVFGKILPC